MNLYTAQQTREWDAYTIAHEPISAIDLMERAATACVQWLLHHMGNSKQYAVFCGSGNNGGDGLAIARLLRQKGASVQVYVLETGRAGTTEFQTNLQRLQQVALAPFFISGDSGFPAIEKTAVLVDALFGSGVNRPLEGLAGQLVAHLNTLPNTIVSVDVPSGLLPDAPANESTTVRARHTLSFQTTKMAFLMPESEPYTGAVSVLNIGLHPAFTAPAPYTLLTPTIARQYYRPRSRFGHKGSYGHVLLVGGAAGKTGALVLAAQGVLRAGAGLCTVLAPKIGYYVLQTAFPEAMCVTDAGDDKLTTLDLDVSRFTTIAIGPGMGTAPETVQAFAVFVARQEYPLVIDADGLNCLAQQPALLSTLPKGSVLTPHPKEFDRLFGASASHFERVALACRMARQFGLYIVLKGHHTLIAPPDGPACFNTTGNAGMATGGSGDVLTGIISGLLAQGYSSLEACQLGVYLHGLAGDIAAEAGSAEALIASDIVLHLGAAFKTLQAVAPQSQTPPAG